MIPFFNYKLIIFAPFTNLILDSIIMMATASSTLDATQQQQQQVASSPQQQMSQYGGNNVRPPHTFVTLRSLIPTKQAGLIIGKSGQNVQEIRETTGARVRISEIVNGSPERVVSISGEPESVAAVRFDF